MATELTHTAWVNSRYVA